MFAAELCARRIAFIRAVRAGEDADLFYRDIARAAMSAADAALVYWKEMKRS